MASITQSKLAVTVGKHLGAFCGVILALILALGWIFVFRPEFARIRQADRTARLQDERAAKLAYLAKLDDLNEEFESFDAEDVERIRTMIPSEEDLPGLMAILEASAQASDIHLTSINFAAGDTAGLPSVDGLGAMNITLNLQHGDYRRFKLFLESLEANLRLFDVRSANINPTGASYSLTIRAYVWTRKVAAL